MTCDLCGNMILTASYWRDKEPCVTTSARIAVGRAWPPEGAGKQTHSRSSACSSLTPKAERRKTLDALPTRRNPLLLNEKDGKS